MTQVMKKINRPGEAPQRKQTQPPQRLQASSNNKNSKPLPDVKDFSFSEFKKIADKSPFTQAEWSAILHLSERTLQRYAKTDGHLAPIHSERAVQIEKLLREGKQAFGSVELFYRWLKRNPSMIEGNLSFDSLTSFDGIQKVSTQLQRIQHGLFA